ncbi:efflux RND transporter periplasmic adaptor subunit [Alteromonas oceanisediminis]|uniref:efflux RND transporter periplasmic adaptor subunit n=1 Tax=Alteromonas oceanisediminis TaxID=2836180 RepID=UPI001BD977AF|nr:efflux RND transporter periplasmic adaptor subunit [Alteromonas oceanisediminis]MBT0587607.1 efflux RND transporter periplasmic adaptor subunit [Alteromonas oceanisediminis]
MKTIWKVAIPFAVLIGGFGIKTAIEASGKEETSQAQVDTRPSVRVEALSPIDYTVTIESFGEVRPLESTTIAAQVAGEVVSWHANFVPGGVVKRGDLLFSIEDDAYVAAKLQAESELIEAKSQLIEEQARADVAAREARNMPKQQVSDLYLRKPQVLSAQARVKSAEARLRIAQRDLDNTQVKAPYDALVVTRDIGVGQYVNVGMDAARLHNIEAAEVVFPIAGFDGQFLPESLTGSAAQIVTRGKNSIARQGVIKRDLGVVDEATRMTNLVVRIDDPYGLESNEPALKYGSYVEVSFSGTTLDNVFKIKQDLVNNNRVWTLDDEQKMVQRTVNVVREEADTFLIDSGLSTGDRLVLTLPEYPQNGMEVVVIDEKQPQTAARTE